MSTPIQNSSSLSFFDLLQSENKVEIPIIQRDYAQGRYDKQEIRNNFLNALFESLNNSKPIKLDFIYGSKVDNAFQPLDGQQRLTTLFLLHWYAALKSNILTDKRDLLTKFSYETRITSREFCKALIYSSIEVSEDKIISHMIKDSRWFFLSWKNDPTIDAMLRTIDDIHTKFFSCENLWDKLTKSKLITFYHVELEDIGLTDDLYIKMNARGKLLSPFENFKASFEKIIKDKDWEIGKPELETFAYKIDTIWTDFFWNKFKRSNRIDDAFMRFISTIIMIRLAVERNNSRIQQISTIHDNPNIIKPEIISEDGFNYLFKCFEVYKNLENGLDLPFPLWRHKPEQSFLAEIVYEDRNISYTQKVLFYAQTEYLLRNENFDEKKFHDWMRVIRNIVSRGSVLKGGMRPDVIRSPETFDGVINLISEIAEGCSDIYRYLNSKDKLNSSFTKEQIEEEKIKAKLILKSEDFRSAIFEMEDKSLFKGRIEFSFDCIEYKNDPDDFNLELFEKINKVISIHLNDEESDKISNDIRRALLTIDDNDGNYDFYSYWWSYWYVGNANKRCLIENFRELEYYMYYTGYRIYLKKLILELIDNSLKSIIDNFTPPLDMPTWKIRLIKEPDLLDVKSKSNYIAIPEDNSCCYLLRSKRPRDLDGCEQIN